MKDMQETMDNTLIGKPAGEKIFNQDPEMYFEQSQKLITDLVYQVYLQKAEKDELKIELERIQKIFEIGFTTQT